MNKLFWWQNCDNQSSELSKFVPQNRHGVYYQSTNDALLNSHLTWGFRQPPFPQHFILTIILCRGYSIRYGSVSCKNSTRRIFELSISFVLNIFFFLLWKKINMSSYSVYCHLQSCSRLSALKNNVCLIGLSQPHFILYQRKQSVENFKKSAF